MTTFFKPYSSGDLDQVRFNRFAQAEVGCAIAEFDTLDTPHKYVLRADGETVLALTFDEHAELGWIGYMLVADNFKPQYTRRVKCFIRQLAEQHRMRKVTTYSRKDTKLVHWHKFFGMLKTGEVELNGVKHDIWSVIWE